MQGKNIVLDGNQYYTSNHSENPTTLICFSHLRWDFVYQRPQHLLSRFANHYAVYLIEEPYFDAKDDQPTLTYTSKNSSLCIVKPHLPAGLSEEKTEETLKLLLDKFFKTKDLNDIIFWYYTPMALPFTRHHKPALTIYDCMDELSHFKFAPPRLTQLEDELLKKADLVFTGGHCLYEYKKNRHANIHPFPSSIDKDHFRQARTNRQEPEDQAAIAGPKLGFYGVIDERFDIELVRIMAEERPEWNFILLGPTAKIDPASIPQLPNVHMLGGKSYNDLPKYVSGWDVALIPFEINDSTRFISPTKTPEYLAAGVPVVSTPIRDVVKPYGEQGIVKIASTADEFIGACDAYMQLDKKHWLPVVDEFLADKSWDATYSGMRQRISDTLSAIKKTKRSATIPAYDLGMVSAGLRAS